MILIFILKYENRIPKGIQFPHTWSNTNVNIKSELIKKLSQTFQIEYNLKFAELISNDNKTDRIYA